MKGVKKLRVLSKRDVMLTFLSFASIALFILFWIAVSSTKDSLIPTPLDVYERFVRLMKRPISNTPILGHVWASSKRVLSGLLLACVFGIPFGLLIGWNKNFNNVFKPIFELIRPVPALAWIPLMTLWLGVEEPSKIALVFIGTLMPVVVNTYAGVRLIPQINIDVAKVFGASKFQMIKEIVLPSSLSAIMAGIRTAMGTAWIVVLAAEMISANTGLGFMIIRGSDVADLSLVIFAMILIGVIGATFSVVLTKLERKLCPWKIEIN